MKVETNLSLVDFVAVTEALADGYFDDDGAYAPHMGLINAMRVFYNVCVTESKFDNTIPHDFVDIMRVDDLAKDDEFYAAFKDACLLGAYDERFTFATAYEKANDIVEKRCKSVLYSIGPALEIIAESLSNALSGMNIKEFNDVLDKMRESGIDAKAIWDAYTESTAFAGNKPNEANNNVVPLKAGE